MITLTSGEASLLEQLRKAKAAQESIDPQLRKPISRPDKYAYPIGLDADGRPFLQPGPARADT